MTMTMTTLVDPRRLPREQHLEHALREDVALVAQLLHSAVVFRASGAFTGFVWKPRWVRALARVGPVDRLG